MDLIDVLKEMKRESQEMANDFSKSMGGSTQSSIDNAISSIASKQSAIIEVLIAILEDN